MKLQQTSQKIENQQLNIRKQNGQLRTESSFKGLEVIPNAALNYLQTNQGVGATFVDAAFMCTPRTIVDFTRGPQAGVETARREFSSNINDALLGAYGLGAAWLVSQGFNNKYDVKANKIRIDKERLDVLSDILYKSGDITKPRNLNRFLDEAIKQTKGLNPSTNEWVGVDKNKIRKGIKAVIREELESNSGKNEVSKIYNTNKKRVESLFGQATGAEGEFRIGKNAEYTSSLGDFVDDLLKTTKAFRSEKVATLFSSRRLKNPKAIANAISENKFLKEFKANKMGTALVGIAACAAVGASVQPINMYLTKKKTGTTGFVGGGKKDDSKKFSVIKKVVAGIAAAAMARTIGSFKDIPSKIQFKGVWPTIPQFKFVYGITIVSRLLSARNKNELRESTIKDSLGFANWLILGGFVSKLTAIGLEKVVKLKEGSKVDNKFIRYNEADNVWTKGLFNGKRKPKWIGGSVISREEVIYQALKNSGKEISIVDEITKKAKPFRKILKEAENIPGVKQKLRLLALAQIAGYAWSALALGIGIPKLNIAITNSVEGKKKAQKPTK